MKSDKLILPHPKTSAQDKGFSDTFSRKIFVTPILPSICQGPSIRSSAEDLKYISERDLELDVGR